MKVKDLILIVEDNEKNRKLVRDILQFNGYQTIEATTAEEGIAIASTQQPALILMDILLPGMDGMTAFKHLRSDPRTQSIPVIAVTASVMPADREKILATGFNACQAKPIDIKNFTELVRQVLNTHQARHLQDRP